MNDDRLIDIESKLAHQEHFVLELNRVLTAQQRQISELERNYETLLKRVLALSDDAVPTQDADRPPHY